MPLRALMVWHDSIDLDVSRGLSCLKETSCQIYADSLASFKHDIDW